MTKDSKPKPSTNIAFAYGWVARMTTIVLEMGLPGLGGQWLDQRFGTTYLSATGFVLGFVIGITHLLIAIEQYGVPSSKTEDNQPDEPAK